MPRRSTEVITVTYPRKALNQFRAAARDAFPREILGFLLGHKASPEHWVIEDIWIPPGQKPATTNTSIDAEAYGRWEVEAEELAREDGQEIIGDIHTHPYYYRVTTKTYSREGYSLDWGHPSLGDFAVGWPGKLAGVVQVQQTKSGRLVTVPKFFPPAPRVVEVAM